MKMYFTEIPKVFPKDSQSCVFHVCLAATRLEAQDWFCLLLSNAIWSAMDVGRDSKEVMGHLVNEFQL